MDAKVNFMLLIFPREPVRSETPGVWILAMERRDNVTSRTLGDKQDIYYSQLIF